MVRYKPVEPQTHLQNTGRSVSTSSATTRRVVFSFMGLWALIGWLYIFWRSDLFSINQIDVRGVVLLDPIDVNREVFEVLDQRRGWRPWTSRNSLFIQKKSFEEAVKERLFAERVTVDNIHNNVLRLLVEERAKRIVYHSHKQYFWVDLDGVVTQELTATERADVQSRLLGYRSASIKDPPVIHQDLDEQIATGYVISQADSVRNWIQLSSQLIKNGLLYREFIPPTSSTHSLVSITAPEGYQILLDTDTPIQPQLDTYSAFIRSQAKSRVYQYLDIRIPGRLYYQ